MSEFDEYSEDDLDRAIIRADIERDLALIRAGLEAGARVCDEGVTWTLNFPPNINRVSKETSRLLAKAIRVLSPETILKEWKGGGK